MATATPLREPTTIDPLDERVVGPRARPDDVIQLHPFYSREFPRCFAIVEAVTEVEVKAYVSIRDGARIKRVQVHVKHGDYATIGRARWCE